MCQVERMMFILSIWPQRISFSVKPWNHSDSKLPNWAWRSLVLSVRQVVCFLLNGCSIQLFMCLSVGYLCSFTSRICRQDPVVGWQLWVLNRGLCLCSPIFSGEHGFFSGGGSRWNKDLMNGDSLNRGCGSLKTQAGWIELRLTEACPLSCLTQTWYRCSLHAGGGIRWRNFWFGFSLYEQRVLKIA